VSRVCLIIDSNLGDVSLAAVAVNRICVHLGLDEIQAREVELCIAEAATNTIRHAYHGLAGETVSIAVSTETDRLHIEVCDTGSPIPAEQVERLIRGADIVEIDRASLLESGRGLQIIHDLMDEVAYTREGNLNRLQLTKHIPIRR
jgi:serine/threonine-protein kinase RsbW